MGVLVCVCVCVCVCVYVDSSGVLTGQKARVQSPPHLSQELVSVSEELHTSSSGSPSVSGPVSLLPHVHLPRPSLYRSRDHRQQMSPCNYKNTHVVLIVCRTGCSNVRVQGSFTLGASCVAPPITSMDAGGALATQCFDLLVSSSVSQVRAKPCAFLETERNALLRRAATPMH